METYKIMVSGRVQGVGYRYYCLKTARLLDIRGYVRNASDGSVEILATGNDADLHEFIALLRQGPMFAQVTDIKIEPTRHLVTENDFRIKY